MTEYRHARGLTATEDIEQECLLRWTEFVSGAYPELKLLYHVPNGGSRNKIEAANLKKQGVKKGVPDLCLPVPRGSYHGLYIELKAKKNKPTQEQENWLAALDAQGYKTAVCWGWETASQVITEYLNKGTTVQKFDALLSHLSDWQRDMFGSPDAPPVSGYDLLETVIQTVREMKGE